MSPQFRTWAAITGTAAVATLGLLVPTAAGAATVHTTPLRTLASTSVLPGVHNVRSDKAAQVHMQFINKTGQTLTLEDGTYSGDNSSWETRPPETVAPGASGFAS